MRRLRTELGITVSVALLVTSGILLGIATQPGFRQYVLQTILLLVSMILVFYSTHPLAHYLSARLSGVDVPYFFISASDFRKLNNSFARMIGANIPTIGTKLARNQFLKSTRMRRAIIMGSGTISSSILMAVPLIYAIISRFDALAIVLGALLLVGNVGFELAFSTKSGDLSKMRKELAKNP